jgi:hypothetical protein
MSTGLTSRQKLKDKLADEDTFATVILTIVLDLYGMDALQWTDKTLFQEIRDDFALDLPKSNLDKLMVGIGLVTTNDFFKRLRVFMEYCNVLSGSDFKPDLVVPPDAMECGWGIVEGLLLSPPDEDEPFTDEIRYFIGKVLDAEGIKDPPDVLAIALSEGSSNYTPNYADMPMGDDQAFANSFQDQQQHRQEIVDTIHEQTTQLIRQLEELPLQNGRAADLMSRLQQGGWRR